MNRRKFLGLTVAGTSLLSLTRWAEAKMNVTKIKFTPDGKALPYQGCTIISHVPEESSFHKILSDASLDLKEQPFAHGLAILPPSSYHATIFGAAADKVRDPGHWPTDVPLDCSFGFCNAAMVQKLQDFDLDCSLPFEFRVHEVDGGSVKIVPVDQDEEHKIRHLRNRFADLLKVRHEDHDTFVFHVTYNYGVQELSPQEKEQFRAWKNNLLQRLQKEGNKIVLPSVALYFFDNMLAYYPQLWLRNK